MDWLSPFLQTQSAYLHTPFPCSRVLISSLARSTQEIAAVSAMRSLQLSKVLRSAHTWIPAQPPLVLDQ